MIRRDRMGLGVAALVCIVLTGCPVKREPPKKAEAAPAAAPAAVAAADAKFAAWLKKTNDARDLNAKGDKAAAGTLYEEIRREANTLDLKRPEVIQGLRDVAFFNYFGGKAVDAEQVFSYVLTLQEQSLGPKNPLIAPDLQNLGNVVAQMGDRARAEELFNRAIAIYQPTLAQLYKDQAANLALAQRPIESDSYHRKYLVLTTNDAPTTH